MARTQRLPGMENKIEELHDAASEYADIRDQRQQLTAQVDTTPVLSLDTNRVHPFADQPREYFDPGELVSLEQSIKQRGQLQPAMVRLLTDDPDHDYELVDGQRRWHACVKLGVRFRAVLIDPEDPEDQFEISVAANFQRAGHTPMEIAKAINRMMDPEHGNRTAAYVATLFGKSDFWVYVNRRLIELVPEIQAKLEPSAGKDQLAVTVACELARLPKDQQLPILNDIQNRGLTSARAIDKIRRILLDGAPEQRPRSVGHANDKMLGRFVRRTIQDADRMFDRMGPDEFRITVDLMHRKKTLDDLRESVMTAIGRLEVLHRRLTELRPSSAPPAAPKPEPSKPKAAPSSTHVYSQAMKCPKCGTVGARFKRRSDADVAKDYWTCAIKGCQLKISHYNIRVDKSYQPQMAKSAGA